MALLTATNPTLMDWKAALDPNHSVGALIELLAETNEIISDLTFIEGNEPTGHLMNVQTGLPPVAWRKLYQGIQAGKGRRTQVRESTAWMEAFNEIDAKLVELNGNGNAFRMQEARMQIEAMSQEMTEKLFYGNSVEHPEQILGLSNRYNDLSSDLGRRNIISGGGTGSDNRSIWLICWGPEGIFCFTPNGIPAGLRVEDLGKEVSENYGGVTGAKLMVWRMHFQWDIGLGVADWRYGVRLANIDYSNLTRDAASGANLPELMAQATRRVPRLQTMRKAWYMSADVLDYLEAQLASAVQNSTLTMEMVGGVPTYHFRGIPIRQVDQLQVDETLVA